MQMKVKNNAILIFKMNITVRLHISSDPQGFSHRNSGFNEHSLLHGARRMSIHCLATTSFQHEDE